jgi:hypothetical protein
MGCCAPYEFPYTNVASATIQYTDDMRGKLGPYPKVEVLQLDPDSGEFVTVNSFSGVEIKFDGNAVYVDFGGLGTGVVKLS